MNGSNMSIADPKLDDSERCDGDGEGPAVGRSGARRDRKFKNGPPGVVLRRLQRREQNGQAAIHRVKPFGTGRHFANSADFDQAWEEYEKETLTQYTKRGGELVPAWNRRRLKTYTGLGKPLQGADFDAFMQSQVPESLIHAKMVRRCAFGYWTPSKSEGEREVLTSKFLRCDARITVDAKRNEKGEWALITRDEYCDHNHTCDQAMKDSSGASVVLNDPKILGEVHRMMQARAPFRNICDTLAMNFGIKITPKQLSNLKRDRLGGLGAMENLKLLLDRFASFPGSLCTLIDDQEGNIIGIFMQSAAQRKMFERFGDNVILDWTHNTNNLYLGSLMVTSVSGRGVSVCDFLCLEQTQDMMTTVFSEFIAANVDAVERIKSFVIDKDYKEWRVLEKLFPSSQVLLCQFHVVKWFAYVVTMRKYNLSVAMREKVLMKLFAMVYSRTTFDFDMHRAALEELVEDVSPAFNSYLTERWYNCRQMWSDCLRARVFTALNTTSNRIESSWNQVKQYLGKNLRIDLCVEAIFASQTAVMRREYRLLVKYMKRLILRTSADLYVQDAMCELAEYAASAMDGQWRASVTHKPGSQDAYVCAETQPSSGVYSISRSAQESATCTVDTSDWSCSCDFHVTSALPCRHMMHASQYELSLPMFPVQSIPSRWCVRSAFDIVSLLEANTNDIQTLRTALLLSDSAFTELVQRDYCEMPTYSALRPRRVTYLRLDRAERGSLVVLNNLEKRNIVNNSFSKIKKFMMLQSTPEFWRMAGQLDTILSDLLDGWVKNVDPTMQVLIGQIEDEDDQSDPDDGGGFYNNNCDEVIAAAIADEESKYFDADNEQISRRAMHDRLSTRREAVPFPAHELGGAVVHLDTSAPMNLSDGLLENILSDLDMSDGGEMVPEPQPTLLLDSRDDVPASLPFECGAL